MNDKKVIIVGSDNDKENITRLIREYKISNSKSLGLAEIMDKDILDQYLKEIIEPVKMEKKHMDIRVLNENEESNKILTSLSEPVSVEEIQTPEFQEMCNKMIEVCEMTGALGCAAPQIGVNKRAFAFRNGSEIMVVINPLYGTRKEQVTHHGEGCLSIPGVYYDVKRWKQCTIEYLDRSAVKQLLKAPNKKVAFILQHEIDHLDGHLINIRGKNKRTI